MEISPGGDSDNIPDHRRSGEVELFTQRIVRHAATTRSCLAQVNLDALLGRDPDDGVGAGNSTLGDEAVGLDLQSQHGGSPMENGCVRDEAVSVLLDSVSAADSGFAVPRGQMGGGLFRKSRLRITSQLPCTHAHKS